MIGFTKFYFAMKIQRFKHALSRRNSLERKCYSNWTRLYYRGNTSSKMLPRQDECRPWFYLGKDEVECGNTASMKRGGPAVRTRQILSGGTVYLVCLMYILKLQSGMDIRVKFLLDTDSLERLFLEAWYSQRDSNTLTSQMFTNPLRNHVQWSLVMFLLV